MRVVAFLLAEQAAVLEDGTLQISGACRNRISGPSFPLQATSMVVIVIEATPTPDEEEAELLIEVFDPQGNAVGGKLKASLVMDAWTAETPIGLPIYAPSAVPLALVMPEPGIYTVRLRLNDELASSFVFHADLDV